MLKLLIDTCVWIDLAKDHHQHVFLRALDQLVKEKKVVVLVPPLVRDEFERNKGNIVERNRLSLSAALKRAKDALDQHGEEETKDQALEGLNYVDQRLPRLGDLTGITAFVELLLKQAETIPITDAAKLRATDRALAKKAPFHKNKNSVADAMLIEAFADVARGADAGDHFFGFVTHNKNDFSVTEGDTRQHHPDFSDIFTEEKVMYFSTLKEALLTVESDVMDELELEEFSDQPRPTDEIVELIGELLDKIWYNRHKAYEAKVVAGKIKLRPYPGKYDPHGVDPEIWQGALRSAKRMEEKYGLENLGPYSDFDWGMMNGKLSALRWIFGEDWETTLDT